MALTKSDIPDLLLPGLKAEFALVYQSELDHSVADQIATVINTTLPIQKYGWLGTVPPMREFVDERRPSGLSAYAASIEDKVFESSIAVDRRAIEDDQLDLIRLRVRDLAFRVATHRHQMVIEALAGGFTATGYDAVSFFHTAHPTVATSTYSNRTTSALSATSLADGINSTALFRFSMAQHRAAIDRVVSVLERSMRRQEELNQRFQTTLESLDRNVRENSALLGRIAERLDFSSPVAKARVRRGA